LRDDDYDDDDRDEDDDRDDDDSDDDDGIEATQTDRSYSPSNRQSKGAILSTSQADKCYVDDHSTSI
jgi:hypothetical protein